MDVYGYPSFQYNQSDELAKQMFAQQALSSSVPFDRTGQEPHVMPVPSGAPWNIQGLPWGMPSPPQLVQFNAQPSMESKSTSVVHCKRKSLDIEPVIPAKQLITEEKMAAHLNGLHISSNYTTHSLASDDMDVAMDAPSTSAASMLMSEKLKGHKIVLSEEVKKLQEEPLLPPALIERLEKPTMSLVVWKPRENIILEKIKEEDKKDSNDTRRNGVLIHELMNDVEM